MYYLIVLLYITYAGIIVQTDVRSGIVTIEEISHKNCKSYTTLREKSTVI